MTISLIKNFVSLNQNNYLKKILFWFGMDIYKHRSSLIDPNIPNSILLASANQQVDKDIILWYKVVVGLLIYIMTITCLNFGYILYMVNQYYANPDSTHIVTAI